MFKERVYFFVPFWLFFLIRVEKGLPVQDEILRRIVHSIDLYNAVLKESCEKFLFFRLCPLYDLGMGVAFFGTVNIDPRIFQNDSVRDRRIFGVVDNGFINATRPAAKFIC